MGRGAVWEGRVLPCERWRSMAMKRRRALQVLTMPVASWSFCSGVTAGAAGAAGLGARLGPRSRRRLLPLRRAPAPAASGTAAAAGSGCSAGGGSLLLTKAAISAMDG